MIKKKIKKKKKKGDRRRYSKSMVSSRKIKCDKLVEEFGTQLIT